MESSESEKKDEKRDSFNEKKEKTSIEALFSRRSNDIVSNKKYQTTINKYTIKFVLYSYYCNFVRCHTIYIFGIFPFKISFMDAFFFFQFYSSIHCLLFVVMLHSSILLLYKIQNESK